MSPLSAFDSVTLSAVPFFVVIFGIVFCLMSDYMEE